jgi:hypothetical protein
MRGRGRARCGRLSAATERRLPTTAHLNPHRAPACHGDSAPGATATISMLSVQDKIKVHRHQGARPHLWLRGTRQARQTLPAGHPSMSDRSRCSMIRRVWWPASLPPPASCLVKASATPRVRTSEASLGPISDRAERQPSATGWAAAHPVRVDRSPLVRHDPSVIPTAASGLGTAFVFVWPLARQQSRRWRVKSRSVRYEDFDFLPRLGRRVGDGRCRL